MLSNLVPNLKSLSGCNVKLLSRYAKVLIQEMNVKLDKSFILALTSLLSKPPESHDEVLFIVSRFQCRNGLIDRWIDELTD